ncbi:spore germination protein [Alicyclobacillus fastidiosus]|uniref:Spore germination protein n=2 Tax=Alicyclobacillus fastidiosus TaxID=392011 RepID=A0ABV5AKD0_9BACL
MKKLKNKTIVRDSEPIASNLLEVESSLRIRLCDCSDIVFRTFEIRRKVKFMLVFVDGMVDTKTLDESLLKPLIYYDLPHRLDGIRSLKDVVQGELLPVAQAKTVSTMNDAIKELLKAGVVVFLDGERTALAINMQGGQERAIEESTSEGNIRGPKDSFTEILRTNTTLLRRRIRNPALKVESKTVGEMTNTDIAIVYVAGVVDESVLEQVRQRIDRINIDGILEAGYIEEFIEDSSFSPFPQVLNTERPDVAASSLLEGKVAIVIDGTPFVLIVPMTFWAAMQAPDDHSERFLYATAIRWIRFILVFLSLTFPSFYVAASTFHPEMIPYRLMLSIANAREVIPFPAVIEAFVMEFMFECLREAGVRLPKSVGSAVTCVGSIVIGQAAVDAGIVSAPMVIVVSVTGIASFTVPRYSFGTSMRLLRFGVLFMAGWLGFFGIAVCLIFILCHLVTLESFGIPYMLPVAPAHASMFKDVFIRVPRWKMNSRTFAVGWTNSRRKYSGKGHGET